LHSSEKVNQRLTLKTAKPLGLEEPEVIGKKVASRLLVPDPEPAVLRRHVGLLGVRDGRVSARRLH
jgi:hypothetical protein